MTWRERLADRLTGGALSTARARAHDAEVLADQRRVEAQRTERRMTLTLRADPDRAAMLSATTALGAVLARFTLRPGSALEAAVVAHSVVERWRGLHAHLSGEAPEHDHEVSDDEVVPDREPSMPTYVHPVAEVRDAG